MSQRLGRNRERVEDDRTGKERVEMRIADLEVGTELGPSGWLTVEQDRIDAFASATEDHQWIHVDPARAAAGPFATTIAHGYLTLALAVPFVFELLPLEGAMIVNYGLDRLRFPAPVPVGSRIRGRLRIEEVNELAGGYEIKLAATIERESGDKPVCVALLILRQYD